MQEAKREPALEDPTVVTANGNLVPGAALPSPQAEALPCLRRGWQGALAQLPHDASCPPPQLSSEPRCSLSRLIPDLVPPQEHPLSAERDSLESHHYIYPAKCHVVPAAAHRP